jgi:hypothetical protein
MQHISSLSVLMIWCEHANITKKNTESVLDADKDIGLVGKMELTMYTFMCCCQGKIII